MIKKNYTLTADDLIIEYMIEKAKNGYNPYFSISEFMDFLNFFERQMKVEGKRNNGNELVKHFLDKEIDKKWHQMDDITKEQIATPHLDFQKDQKILQANHRFRQGDTHLLECYLDKEEIQKIREIIREYLTRLPKRNIIISDTLSSNELLIGNLIAANMINYIWKDYRASHSKYQEWPIQCQDIHKYLLEMDLAAMIELPSIKEQTLEFYNIISRRIASLYQNDKKLHFDNKCNGLLAYSNFLAIMNGYEDYASSFNPKVGKRELTVDLRVASFTEAHKVNRGCYSEIQTISINFDNDDAKKLVHALNRMQK